MFDLARELGAKRNELEANVLTVLDLSRDAKSFTTGPEVEYSPSLRFLDTGPLVLVSPADAGKLGVSDGEAVEVQADGDSVEATVVIRTGVPDGSIFLSPLTLAEGPAEVRTRQQAVAG